MNRIELNYIVDVILFVLMIVIIFIGFMLGFFIPTRHVEDGGSKYCKRSGS
jgi:uncharacterized protein YneF (UPF0154 family)